MNLEERTAFIRRTMLTALADCGPYALVETTFLSQLNVSIVPPLTRQEFEAELHWLESNHFVVGVHGDLGGPAKWKITPDGKAVLAS